MNIRKTLPIKAALVAATITAGVGITAGSVSAHHPNVSGQATCLDSGRYEVTWTATADAVRGKTWSTSAPDVRGPAPDSQAFTFIRTYDGTTTSASLSVTASWSGGPSNQTRTGSISLGGDCVPPTTTTQPTTTTTLPPTTTTEPPPTTTEPPVVCVDPPNGQDPCAPPTTEPPCEGICGPATPPSTDPPVTTDCVDFETGERWPLGEYVIPDADEVTNFRRSVELSGQPCDPKTDDPPAVPAAPVDPPAPDEPLILAATGPSLTWMLVAVALAAVAAGAGAVIVARRPEVEA